MEKEARTAWNFHDEPRDIVFFRLDELAAASAYAGTISGRTFNDTLLPFAALRGWLH